MIYIVFVSRNWQQDDFNAVRELYREFENIREIGNPFEKNPCSHTYMVEVPDAEPISKEYADRLKTAFSQSNSILEIYHLEKIGK